MGTTVTWCGWVKMVTDRGFAIPIGQSNGGANYIQHGSNGTRDIILSGASGGMTAGTKFTVGTWTFIAATINASGSDTLWWAVAPATTLSSFTSTVGGLNDTSSFWISNDGFGSWWNGSVACVRVWSAILTQAQLEAELPKRSAQRATNLWASYELNGPSLVDSSGNSRTLTAGAGTPATDTSGPPVT
jgi:hypothetical protein